MTRIFNFNPENPNQGKREKRKFKEVQYKEAKPWPEFRDHFLAFIKRRRQQKLDRR